MMVYVDDDEPVFVERLSLGEARAVLARVLAALPRAVNSAHEAALRSEVAEVEDQIDWLERQGREMAARERAAEMAYGMWVDRQLGLPS